MPGSALRAGVARRVRATSTAVLYSTAVYTAVCTGCRMYVLLVSCLATAGDKHRTRLSKVVELEAHTDSYTLYNHTPTTLPRKRSRAIEIPPLSPPLRSVAPTVETGSDCRGSGLRSGPSHDAPTPPLQPLTSPSPCPQRRSHGPARRVVGQDLDATSVSARSARSSSSFRRAA